MIFLQSLKEDIKELKEESKESHTRTNEHLEKTCDEIKEVVRSQNKMAIQVSRIDERLDNHVESSEIKRVSKREWVMIGITVVMTIGAFFAIFPISYNG